MKSYEYDGDLEALLHNPAEREKLVAKVWTDGYGRSGQHLWETRDLLSTLLGFGFDATPKWLSHQRSGGKTSPQIVAGVPVWTDAEVGDLMLRLFEQRRFLRGHLMAYKTEKEIAKDERDAAAALLMVDFLATHDDHELDRRYEVADDDHMKYLIHAARLKRRGAFDNLDEIANQEPKEVALDCEPAEA